MASSTSIEYARKMLHKKIVSHEIKSPLIKQTITIDSVSSTDWVHRESPRSNFWSKSQSNRFDLEAPLVVTVLTTIIDGNGTLAQPTKLLTKFMTQDSTDITNIFSDKRKFNYRKGINEFILNHRDFLDQDWRDRDIRYSEMHFNMLYVGRLVSFVHLFLRQNFSGSGAREVFCNCTGENCFVDTTYVESCTEAGERKWVSSDQDSTYLVYALNRPDYDGTVPGPGQLPRTGNEELKKILPRYISIVVGFTPQSDSSNNSFYAFIDKKKWSSAVGTSGFKSEAEAVQKIVVAHEIGHHFFGPSHARDPNHLMYSAINTSVIPLLTLPIRTEDGTLINSFTLTSGIWSQP